MSSSLCVLRAESGAGENAGAGPAHGFGALEQSVLVVDRGATAGRATGACEEVLFVIDGAGALRLHGEEHALDPESGAYLAPGAEYELAANGSAMQVVRVRIPDPEPAHGTPATRAGTPAAGAGTQAVVRRLEDQEAHEATTHRQFRIVADPSSGLRSATCFVGYVPTVRAPEHFHTYDEVIYVLSGEGQFHAEGATRAVGPGTCIGLPARLVHCLENTGEQVMRLLAVFRPAGSPAAAYYPDGTPAYPGLDPLTQT
jgi:quercetin dioxygenase-like cupin family protein